MPIIYLIRHTTPNAAKGLCYGRLVVDVAPTFAAEATQIRLALTACQVDKFYSSPSQRCTKLAQYLAGKAPVQTDARLQEINFGDWEGQRFDDIPRAQIDAWAADVQHFVFPNGESPAECKARVQNFYTQQVLSATQDCAIVAHGGSIKALLSIVADVPLTQVAAWDISFGAVIAIKI